jgi:hypothetical protein
VSDEKLTPSILYTTEAEESKKKSEEELDVEDPEKAEAAKIIQENVISETSPQPDIQDK